MSKKTIDLQGVLVWVSGEASLHEASFFRGGPSAPRPLLGGSLAALTRGLRIDAGTESCFFKIFHGAQSAPWLTAALAAFQFPVDQRFSVSLWSSPDPLHDGCITLLSMKPSKIREQSCDVVAVVDAFVAREDARYLDHTEEHLRGVYRDYPRERYTDLMRWVRAPSFVDGSMSINYGLLLVGGERGAEPLLWVWSRLVFYPEELQIIHS